MRHAAMGRPVAACAAWLAGTMLAADGRLGAQRGIPAEPSGPRITVHGVRHVTAVAEWPGVSLSVSDAAYVVVFALTRGPTRYPVQVLSPVRPGDDGRVRRGAAVPLRSLDRDDLTHLMDEGQAPLVVAFASTTRPTLAAFEGSPRRWGRGLVLDTVIADPRQLVATLGETIFPQGTAFTAVTTTASEPMMLSANRRLWYFDEACAGYSARLATMAGPGQSLFDGRPSALPWMWGGAPLRVGEVVWGGLPPLGMQVLWVGSPIGVDDGCPAQRMAWVPVGWTGAPRVAATGRADSLLMPLPGEVGRPDTLLPRLPRVPGVDERLVIGDGWAGRTVPADRREAVHDDLIPPRWQPTPPGRPDPGSAPDPGSRGEAPPRLRRDDEPGPLRPLPPGEGPVGRGELASPPVERERRPPPPPPSEPPHPPPPPPPPPAEPPPPKPPVPPG